MAKRYKISIQDTQIVTASNEDEAIQMVQETLCLSNLNYDVEEVNDENVKINNDKSKWSLTTEQQKQLEEKHWNVLPKARFLDLYNDDFQGDIWQDVCQVFDCDCGIQETEKLTLLVVGVKTND